MGSTYLAVSGPSVSYSGTVVSVNALHPCSAITHSARFLLYKLTRPFAAHPRAVAPHTHALETATHATAGQTRTRSAEGTQPTPEIEGLVADLLVRQPPVGVLRPAACSQATRCREAPDTGFEEVVVQRVRVVARHLRDEAVLGEA